MHIIKINSIKDFIRKTKGSVASTSKFSKVWPMQEIVANGRELILLAIYIN